MSADTLYTKKQQAVVDGTIRPEKVGLQSLKRIIEIAESTGDTDTVERLTPTYNAKLEEKRAKRRIEGLRYYYEHKDAILAEMQRKRDAGEVVAKSAVFTQHQQDIIDGKIPYEEVRNSDYGLILRKAERLGRTDVIELIRPLSERKAAEYKIHRKEQRQQDYQDRKNGIPVKKRKYTYHHKGMPYITKRKADADEYTERQKAIIRGEISFEDTHGNEYLAIERKARKKGDIAVIELVHELIAEKRADYIERNRQKAREYYREHGYDPDSNYHKRRKLSHWERGVLYGVVDLDMCPQDHLRHIIDVCRLTEDDVHLALAEQLLLYKTKPASVYKYHGREALEAIRQLTFMPIPEPKNWTFREDNDYQPDDDSYEPEEDEE